MSSTCDNKITKECHQQLDNMMVTDVLESLNMKDAKMRCSKTREIGGA